MYVLTKEDNSKIKYPKDDALEVDYEVPVLSYCAGVFTKKLHTVFTGLKNSSVKEHLTRRRRVQFVVQLVGHSGVSFSPRIWIEKGLVSRVDLLDVLVQTHIHKPIHNQYTTNTQNQIINK